MKKRLAFFTLLLIVGIIFFVSVILETGIDEIWSQLRQFKLLHFVIFIGLSTLNFTLYNLRWYLILGKLHHKKLSFWQLFMHRMSGFAVSYITPSAQTGGEPLRVMLLSEEGVPGKTATSSVIIDKGLELAALFVFIAAGVLTALACGSLPPEIRVAAGVIMVLIIVLIFWFYFSSLRILGFSVPYFVFFA